MLFHILFSFTRSAGKSFEQFFSTCPTAEQRLQSPGHISFSWACLKDGIRTFALSFWDTPELEIGFVFSGRKMRVILISHFHRNSYIHFALLKIGFVFSNSSLRYPEHRMTQLVLSFQPQTNSGIYLKLGLFSPCVQFDIFALSPCYNSLCVHFDFRKIGFIFSNRIKTSQPQIHANKRFHLQSWFPDLGHFCHPVSWILYFIFYFVIYYTNSNTKSRQDS